MAVHLQPQQQFELASVPAIAGSGCEGNQAATLMQMVPPTKFRKLKSNLNSDTSGSRKRARDEPPPSDGLLRQQQFLLQRHQSFLIGQIQNKTTHAAAELQTESSRHMDSATASTSGRRPVVDAAQEHLSSAAFPIYNDNIGTIGASVTPDVDALVRLRAEHLLSGIEVACKRHFKAVIAAMEQEAQQRVAAKQAELEAATMRSAELEGRLRQAAAESQAWFDVARNSEALVARLRANLEQVLKQRHVGKNSNNFNGAPREDLCGVADEGYGDSEEEAASAAGSTAVIFSVPCAEASTGERVIGEPWVSSGY